MVEIHLAYLQPDQDTLGAYLVRQHQGNHLDRLVYNSCQMQISDHKLESELAYQSYLGDNQVVHTFLVQVPSYLDFVARQTCWTVKESIQGSLVVVVDEHHWNLHLPSFPAHQSSFLDSGDIQELVVGWQYYSHHTDVLLHLHLDNIVVAAAVETAVVVVVGQHILESSYLEAVPGHQHDHLHPYLHHPVAPGTHPEHHQGQQKSFPDYRGPPN